MLKRGFSLIEVLVTLVILMFGLLGIAGLMAKGQRASFEGFQRQQALSLANDMAERIRNNRRQTDLYTTGATIAHPVGLGAKYNDVLIGNTVNCAHAQCSNLELANYDIGMWDGLLNGYSESQVVGNVRVGGIVEARGCIEEAANTIAICPTAVCPNPPAFPTAPCSTQDQTFTRSLLVSVAWLGNEDTGTQNARPSACGTGLYGNPVSDGLRRLVTIQLLLQERCP